MDISYLDHTLHLAPTLPPITPEEAFQRLRNGEDVEGYCDGRTLVAYLHEHFRWIPAAGGVVNDYERNRLLIRRWGRWDLPKGMVEPGEKLQVAALREVMEETGLKVTHLCNRPIMKTYHIFERDGIWCFKPTAWYDMLVRRVEPIVYPQTEEDITAGVWMKRKEWMQALDGSYATLRLLGKNWDLGLLHYYLYMDEKNPQNEPDIDDIEYPCADFSEAMDELNKTLPSENND